MKKGILDGIDKRILRILWNNGKPRLLTANKISELMKKGERL